MLRGEENTIIPNHEANMYSPIGTGVTDRR